MEFKPMQPPENFDLWLLVYDNETIKNIYIELAPYKKYVPNLEFFLYNMFNSKNGIFFNFLNKVSLINELEYTDIEKYQIEIINKYENFINNFDTIEKTIFYKIIETNLSIEIESKNYVNNNAEITYEDENGISKEFFEYINIESIFYFVHKYFELKYNQNKHILPFIIYDKTNISNVIDENPDLSWFIDNKTPTATAPEPQQFTFENNFDEVNKDIVYNYFKENLVDKKYISIEVLESFLLMAFQEKNPPENKFNFEKIRTQSNIKKIFYQYYNVKAQKPYGKKAEYVNLLCNYFIGYNAKKVSANFNK